MVLSHPVPEGYYPLRWWCSNLGDIHVDFQIFDCRAIAIIIKWINEKIFMLNLHDPIVVQQKWFDSR